MTFRLSRAALLGIGAISLVGAGSRQADAQTSPIRVATDPFDSYAEAYYAADRGFFKKAALDVQVISFSTGGAIMTGIASGNADIGISNPVLLANAIGHGIPFTTIAGGGMYSTKAPTTLLCVAAKSPLQNAADLNGKTIAVTGLKDILYAAAKAWLAQQGALVSTVQFIELPFPEMGPALQRGTIDAALLAEPALEAALRKGEVRIFAKPFDAIAPQFIIGAWFSTRAYVRKNPDLIKRFVSAIYDTARWANRNHDASAEILAKYSKMLPETTRNMRRVVYAESLTPALVQPMLDVAYKNGVLDKPVTFAEMI